MIDLFLAKKVEPFGTELGPNQSRTQIGASFVINVVENLCEL
jgi:hypothetical protein